MFIYYGDYVELDNGTKGFFIALKDENIFVFKDLEGTECHGQLGEIKKVISKKNYEESLKKEKVRITNGVFKGREGYVNSKSGGDLWAIILIENDKETGTVIGIEKEFLEVMPGPIEKKESPRKSDKFFMVWRDKGSASTKKHETYKLAQEEAKRLAKNNPNVKFYILEALEEIAAEVEIKEKKLG